MNQLHFAQVKFHLLVLFCLSREPLKLSFNILVASFCGILLIFLLFSLCSSVACVMSCLRFSLPAEVQSSSVLDKELPPLNHKKREGVGMLEKEEFPKENGVQPSNGIMTNYRPDRSEERQHDVMDDNPGKSRSTFQSCHTSVISYAYHFFQIWYFIQS